mgnify:FL=1
MKKIDVKSLQDNVFSLIGDRWMLITAGTAERCNTMTASWGGLGVLWNANVAFSFVRPSRYTYEFLEQDKYYTLSFFDSGYRRALQICGSKSGRDTDKIREAELTPVFDAQAPYFAESRLSLVCRKLYYQDMDPSHFLDPTLENNYKNGDYHRIYVGEIVKVLKNIG